MNHTRGTARGSVWVVGMAALAALLAGVAAAPNALKVLPLLTLMAAIVGVGARWRVAARPAVRKRRRQRLVVVGVGPVARHVVREAECAGCEVLGQVSEHQGERPGGALGTLEELPRLVHELEADRVVVAEAPSRAWAVRELLLDEGLRTDVLVVPDRYELAVCRPTSLRVGDVPLYRLPQPKVGGVDAVIKRAFDVALSLVLLVLLAPVMLLAMLAVRLGSPGPALFRQERVGRDGRLFRILKLRTMVADAEKDGPQLCAGKHDPRLTPVGRLLRKTHLDEAPQLWNVLKGEMSLVGPRPERPCFVEQFQQEFPRYRERHRIQPGITGLAQINGYYHSSPREKLRYDLMYLYHRSLWMDLWVLLCTVCKTFLP